MKQSAKKWIGRSIGTGVALAAMLAAVPWPAWTKAGIYSAGYYGASYINGVGSTLGAPALTSEFAVLLAGNPFLAFQYGKVGSGIGRTAFINNDCTVGRLPNNCTSVTFATAADPIGASQLSKWNSTPSGFALSGPLIQVPTLVTPLTIPFVNSGLEPSPGLTLTDTQLCGVFSGKIAHWHVLTSHATPGPITVVYRSDVSAQTWLLTQHLAAVCNSANSDFTASFAATEKFESLPFPSGQIPPHFVGVVGSGGMQKALLEPGTAGIGYLGPDFTSIAPGSPRTSSLRVARLVNATEGAAYLPTIGATARAFRQPGPGATNMKPPGNLLGAANPTRWAPQLPTPAAGYPIVGVDTWDMATCYQTTGFPFPTNLGFEVSFALQQFLTNSTYASIQAANGFATLRAAGANDWVNAILTTFTSNASGFNLDINDFSQCFFFIHPGR
jgi:ABC-type phosphate transport system substrate-binding protein